MDENKRFMKRFYSPRAFYRLLSDMLLNIQDMREARKAQRVSNQFSERIMMAVTEVNGCRYCSYFHTQVALKAGMDKGEIAQTLAGDFKDAPPDELAALYFAQHYAESGGDPHPEAVQCMRDTYGEVMTRDILAVIRAIMIGNAWGNMFDALRWRIKGKPSSESSLWGELGVVLGIFWMMSAVFIQRAVSKIGWKRKTHHTS